MSTGSNNFYSGGRFDPEFLRRMKRIVARHGRGPLSSSEPRPSALGPETLPPTYRIGDYRRESTTEMKPAGERAAVMAAEWRGEVGR